MTRTCTLAILALLAATPASWAQAPVFYGDGSHDDYPALQAMLDGKPARIASARLGNYEPPFASIENARMCLSHWLVLHGTPTVAIVYSTFEFAGSTPFNGSFAFIAKGSNIEDRESKPFSFTVGSPGAPNIVDAVPKMYFLEVTGHVNAISWHSNIFIPHPKKCEGEPVS